MAQPSPEFLRIVALLNFEDWTPADKVIEALTFTIKPLRALERYERNSRHDQAKRAAEREQKIRAGTYVAEKANSSAKITSREGQIRAGARSILNDTLASLRDAGIVEQKNVDGERLLRRKERRQGEATRFLVCCHHGLPCPESANLAERGEHEEVVPLD